VGDKLLKNSANDPSTSPTPRMSSLLSSDSPSPWTLGALLVRGLAAAGFFSPFPNGRKRPNPPPVAGFAVLLAAGAAPGFAVVDGAAAPRFRKERLTSLLDDELDVGEAPGLALDDDDGDELPPIPLGLLPKADVPLLLDVSFFSSSLRPGMRLVMPPSKPPPPPDFWPPDAGFEPEPCVLFPIGRREVNPPRPPDFWSPPLAPVPLSLSPPPRREPMPPRTPPEPDFLSSGLVVEGELLPDPPKREGDCELLPGLPEPPYRCWPLCWLLPEPLGELPDPPKREPLLPDEPLPP
jgi:hypothetical protein